MDPELPYQVCRLETEVLEYSSIIVPSAMRSSYWKYFGFPADSYNNILTRKKVICSICHTAIAYNKNTTNLRMHLAAKHTDILHELHKEKKLQKYPVTEDKSQTDMQRKEILKVNTDNSDTEESHNNKIIYPSMDNDKHSGSSARTNAVLKIDDPNSLIETLTDNEIIEHQSDSENNDYTDFSQGIDQQSYEIEEIDGNTLRLDDKFSDYAMADKTVIEINSAVATMLSIDLLPPSFVEKAGFLTLLLLLRPSDGVPDKTEVENILNRTYEDSFQKIYDIIKTHSQHQNFSVSIENWHNFELKQFVSIYIHHIENKDVMLLDTTLFKTIEVTNRIDYEHVFAGINMSNCASVLFNTHNDNLVDFFQQKGIPILPCFEYTIRSCLKNIFAIPDVNETVNKIKDFLKENIELYDNNSFPIIHEEFPLTKYNLLNYFLETTETLDNGVIRILLIKAKEIVTCITPFKTILETLCDESSAFSSLMNPLSTELTKHHFQYDDNDSQLTFEIKQTVCQELNENILCNEFLKISSFFDPRFQRFVIPEDVQIIRKFLEKKYGGPDNERSGANKHTRSQPINRKSSLKLFFNNCDKKPQTHSTASSLEMEICKYISEPNADMDQCPIVWWEENGYVYNKLKNISQTYICTPCCLNNSFRLPTVKQIDFYNNRFMLSGNLIPQLLFSHILRKDF